MSNVINLDDFRCYDRYFNGACPTCHHDGSMLNIGRGHWGYCTTHKVKWFIGSNLYSSWRDQTEEEQYAEYVALGFDSYREVEGYYGPARPPRPLTAKELAASELANMNIPF